MKKLILLFFVLAFCSAHAQFRGGNDTEWHMLDYDNKAFSWGYFLGVNRLDFKITPDDGGLTSGNRTIVTQDSPLGFTVGMIGKMRLNDYLDLRLEPNMNFIERTLYFNNISTGPEDSVRVVKSTYLDLPLMLNFHGKRWANKRPFIAAGMGYTINLTSNEGKEDDNSNGTFRMKTHNFNYQFEAGVELYFKRFKLTPAVKGIFFLNNELVPDNPDTSPQWAGTLRSIKTRGVFFSLKFE